MFKGKFLSEDSIVAIIMTTIVCGTISYCAKCMKDAILSSSLSNMDPELIQILKNNIHTNNKD